MAESSAIPQLPSPLAFPLGLIPGRTHSKLLVKALNRLFAPELEDGELDFLEGKVMQIRITDAKLCFRVTLYDDQLHAADEAQGDDLSIEGATYDFLLLASRKEDPDTLFFNRRLRLGGDTELGLYVKNFLDALELEDRLGPMLPLLNNTTNLVARLPKISLPRPLLGRR